jgi:hypothetical protein
MMLDAVTAELLFSQVLDNAGNLKKPSDGMLDAMIVLRKSAKNVKSRKQIFALNFLQWVLRFATKSMAFISMMRGQNHRYFTELNVGLGLTNILP